VTYKGIQISTEKENAHVSLRQLSLKKKKKKSKMRLWDDEEK